MNRWMKVGSSALVLLCAWSLGGCATSALDASSSPDAAHPVALETGGAARAAQIAPVRYEARQVPSVFGAASDAGCGLPCETGVTQWHVRLVGGYAMPSGEDDPDASAYYGFDFGRTACDSCWSLDVFYRRHDGDLDRQMTATVVGAAPVTTTVTDDGSFNHVGIKAAWERSFSRGSKWYWWLGVGPEYFWTEDYGNDDEGFGLFLEAGVGVNVSRNVRVRGGVNLHGMDTDVTRSDPINDGSQRWLWILAPVIEVEFAF